MTPQEAIKYLKIDKDIRETCVADDSGSMLFCEALKLAISAIEKQIPKKPKDIGHFIKIYVCSCCENSVLLQPSFCENCGQALDWSNEE